MNAAVKACCFLFLSVPLLSAAEQADNPIAGVITLMTDLEAKIKKVGVDEGRAYEEFFEWCDEVTGEKLHSIKLNEERKAKLMAAIEKYFAEIEQSGEQISEEAKAIAQAIAEGKNAKDLREKQHADFMAAEKDLVDSVDMLSRAITVLQKEMQKGSAAFAQISTKRVTGLMQVLGSIAEAAAFTTSDKSKLLALVQAQQGDGELASPSADVYSSKSGGIVELLEDMKDKAENQLSDLRKGEQQARYVFNQLVAALKAQQKADEQDKKNEEADKAEATEEEAESEEELTHTREVLDVHSEAYRKTKAECMQSASDHEASVKSRDEELKVIAKAKEILEESTGGAVSRRYSLLQENLARVSLHSTADLVHLEVITLVKSMAKKHHSSALAQLASRISAVVQYGAANREDIFGKVKGLITDLIAKLEQEAKDAATEKAYCDEQLANTNQKKADLDDALAKIKAELDKKSAKFADVKDDIAFEQEGLAKLAKEQKELDKIRDDEHAAFVEEKTDLEKGLEGVRKALGMLRDYYSEKDDGAAAAAPEEAPVFLQSKRQPTPPETTHSKSSGAAAGIMEILEMTESDFAAGLAKAQTQESDAQSEYDEASKVNEVERTESETQVKFLTKQFKMLEKTIATLSSDRDSLVSEQTAVLEFDAKLRDRCIAEPETYAEIKRRRDAEITGLKEALQILKTEAAFLQHPRLRGA
jgi:hypothetical protein